MNKEDIKQGEEVFSTLFKVNVSDKVEKKNGLAYLSWSYAWGEVKKSYPWASYTIYENKDGFNYHHDGRTGWVKVGVTICGLEHIEYLPIMNHSNKSIPLDSITSYEVNKSIQRAITKAIARHGLGLYIYSGEDLPEVTDGTQHIPTKSAEQPKNHDHGPLSKLQPKVLKVVGDIESIDTSSNGWTKVKINGVELSTKKSDLVDSLTDIRGDGKQAEVEYMEQQKGQFTNRYIEKVREFVEAGSDAPF